MNITKMSHKMEKRMKMMMKLKKKIKMIKKIKMMKIKVIIIKKKVINIMKVVIKIKKMMKMMLEILNMELHYKLTCFVIFYRHYLEFVHNAMPRNIEQEDDSKIIFMILKKQVEVKDNH